MVKSHEIHMCDAKIPWTSPNKSLSKCPVGQRHAPPLRWQDLSFSDTAKMGIPGNPNWWVYHSLSLFITVYQSLGTHYTLIIQNKTLFIMVWRLNVYIYIYFLKKWSLVSSQSPTITSIRMHNIHSYTISVQKSPTPHLSFTYNIQADLCWLQRSPIWSDPAKKIHKQKNTVKWREKRGCLKIDGISHGYNHIYI